MSAPPSNLSVESAPSAPARPWAGVPVLAGFVAGCAAQLQQPELWGWAVYGFFLALSSVIWSLFALERGVFFRPQRRLVRPMALALAAALAGFALCGLRAGAFSAQALTPALEGRDLVLTGVVSAMPQRSDGGVRFRLAVESATADGVPVAVPPRVLLGWWGGVAVDEDGLALQRHPGEVRAGERWRLGARLKAPHGNRNPHGFDHELWLWEQGLQATGTVRAGPRDVPPARVETTQRYPVEQARQAVRDAILLRVGGGDAAAPDAALRQRTAGILAALVTGDQAVIERADWDVFRATGVAHLMSISGLHITLFAWVAAAVVGGLWRRSARWGWPLCARVPAPHAAAVGGWLLAAGYAVFAGWGVPAQRTVLMLAVVVLLRLSGRHWPWPLVWLAACASVVAADPWALLQAGFWLSFVAVGVLFASDSRANNDHLTLGKGYFLSKLMQLVREQGVVTLALTPLSLLLFGQVSVVGLLANLVAIPWVTLVVTPLALGGVVVSPLWDAAAWALQPLTALLGGLAAWPLASVSVPAAPLWAGGAGVAGGLLLVLRLPLSVRALGLPLLAPVLLWQAPRPPSGVFELLAADIGQGNAVLVRTAAHTLVYDAGPRFSAESDAGHRVLVPLLRALGENVDTLVLSHRDTDHTGGAAAVLTQQPQAVLRSSIADDHALQALRVSRRCEAGQHWRWDGVDFQFLHPQPADYDVPHKPNAVSCVLRVSAGGRVALLTGDIEAAQEARLVAAEGSRLRADVLLVPHHGSKTSSTPAFLDAVAPRWALVQAGYRNRFGHPAAPVAARYADRGLTLVESAGCGAATWSSASPDALRCERMAAPRYWQHRMAAAPTP